MAEKIGLEAVFQTAAFATGLKKYTSGLSQASSETLSKGGAIGRILGQGLAMGMTAFAALGAAAVVGAGVVGGAITKMVFDAAKLGDKFSQMSEQTGISTTRLQELQYAGKLLDVDLEVMTNSLRFLTRNMYAAKDGTGEQAEAFDQLKIKIKDSKGQLRDANTVWGEAIDALGAMENPTMADAIAMKLMGRSAMELNPLINAGSKQLAIYSNEAHDMGAVVDEEGVKSLDVFQDRWEALGLSVKGNMAKIALSFLPGFAKMENGLRSFTGELSNAVTSSKGDFKLMSYNISIVLARAIRNIKADLPGLVQGIKDLLPTLFQTGFNFADMLFNAATGKKLSITNVLDTIFGGLSNFGTSVLAWAKKIDWSSLSQGLADGIRDIEWAKYGTQFGQTLVKLGTALVTAFKNIKWGELAKAAGTGFADFVVGTLSPGKDWQTGVYEVWKADFDQLAEMVAKYGWFEVGQRMVSELIKGFMTGFAQLMNTLGMFQNIPGVGGNPSNTPNGLPPGVQGPPASGAVVPSNVLPPVYPGNVSPIGATGGNTTNITINNPSPEPASTSVSLAMKKLSYLGIV